VLKRGEAVFLKELPSRLPGWEMYIDTRLDPIKTGDGRVIGAVITRQDVTDRVQRQREEKRRAALDRVRVSVYEMRGSADIQNVLTSLYEALRDVGMDFDTCSVQIVNEGESHRAYGITQERIHPVMEELATEDRETNNPVYHALRDRRPIYRRNLDEEDLYNERMDIRASCGKPIRSVLDVPFSHGTIALNSVRQDAFPEEDIKILGQFAEVLSEAYTRFEDMRRIEESEQTYRELVENIVEVIYATDEQGVVTYVSPAIESFIGYRPSEVIGHHFREFVYPEDLPRLREAFGRILSGHITANEYRALTRSGETRWMHTSSRPALTGDRVTGVRGVLTDITERKQAEQILAWEYRVREAEAAVRVRIAEMEQPEGLHDVVEEISDQLKHLDVDHDSASIQVVNSDGTDFVSAAKRKEGRPDHWEKVTNESWGELTPNPQEYPWVIGVWRTGTPLYQPCVPKGRGTLSGRSLIDVPFSQGTLAINSTRSHAFSHKDVALLQRFAHVMSDGFQRFIDIFERRRAEKAFREAEEKSRVQERLSAVGQLAAGIAHDFNNLLTGIIGYAQLLTMRTDVSELAKRDVRRIEQEGQHAARLIRQILDFSRKSIIQRQPLELTSFLKESIKFLRRTISENIRISLDVEPNRYLVQADPAQIQDMLTNLSVNARDAMPGGGDLRFRLSRFRLKEEDIPPFPEMPPGEWIELSVSDTGSGIAPEHLPRVFEPFFTTKKPDQGTGLGLAQVYGIVMQHEGFIDVDSPPGKGTTFMVYLSPLVDAGNTSKKGTPTRLSRGRGETILVVEDEPTVLEMVGHMLEELGYRALKARNGEEALVAYDRHRDGIVLVLTDIVMPGMDGIQVFRALRTEHPDVKVAAMTGYPLDDEGDDLLSEGFVAWVQKPLDLGALIRILDTIEV